MSLPLSTSTLPVSFKRKKAKILADLAVPEELYDDLSPKGSIDIGIRDLIDEINAFSGFVTTSSCAGRVSVFAEGQKKVRGGDSDDARLGAGDVEQEPSIRTLAATGGKGGGGRWLFVSHDKVDSTGREQDLVTFLGLHSYGDVEGDAVPFKEERLIHFKFEPMILHVLTASLQHAQTLLNAALQAGFRESGALNLISSTNNEPATPMVAVRSMGLGLESVIGRLSAKNERVCIVPESYLSGLLSVANERFVENTKRIERFRRLLADSISAPIKLSADGGEWEDAETRKARKRAEGLRRAEEIRATSIT